MRLLTDVCQRIGRAVRFGFPPAARQIERRDPTARLKDGASRACPSCSGSLVFREGYLIMRIERNTMEPAWICYTHPCGHREFVRK
jgi:hypothetical protein